MIFHIASTTPTGACFAATPAALLAPHGFMRLGGGAGGTADACAGSRSSRPAAWRDSPAPWTTRSGTQRHAVHRLTACSTARP
eukprot:1566438-Prymnesium_polylepis.1